MAPAARGLRHSKGRDAEAIHHHYDVSNRFYEMVLGPSMTYTCAVLPDARTPPSRRRRTRSTTWSPASSACSPGMRLLDVGCGWGGMVRHAAKHYGVEVVGVTLSREQAAWAQEAIKREGLDDLAEVRYVDYRDVRGDRLRRGQLDRADRAHRRPQLPGVLLASCATSWCPAAGCSTTASPGRTTASTRHRRVHRPLRLPRRRADRVGPDHHRDPGRRPRGAARGEPARALRPDPARAGATTWSRTGTSASPRSARAPRGSGVSTWPARGCRLRAQRDPAAPGARGQAGRRTATPTSRCGPTWVG